MLSYTRFVADVGTGAVRTVTIGPAGQVTGGLADGQPFTTTIPVALGDRTLAGDLAAHHVQVTATAATGSSLSTLIGLLSLLLIGGLLYSAVRGFRRQAAGLGGGLGGAAGLTRAKARVIDAERPATRFADVAGYPRGEDGDRRGRRLPARPWPLPPGRGTGTARRADGRAARHRQDPARARRRRRSPRPVPVRIGLELRGDVRRRRRCPGPGPVRAGTHPRAGDRVHRRDRRPRRPPRPRRPARQRRAGADPQPATRRDGRVRGLQRGGGTGRHQPAGRP